MFHKIKHLLFLGTAVVFLSILLLPMAALAAEDDDGEEPVPEGLLRNVMFNATGPSEPLPAGTVTFDDPNSGAGEIYTTLIRYVNVASIGVGVVAGFGAAIAGVQYASSRGDPGKTAAAVKRITQVAIAIFLYIFGLVIINWLVPGGVLNDAGPSGPPTGGPGGPF